ncbi:alkylation response protein AidB-like acyl-CoA dehydrogenase [Streptomyces phaeochromogenes]|jgi:alkylation response protein AidB-like acyl-CoA dehydrogenase|uniref:acyl-CoA dehydrogenase family protein n=1 Tax=Streptomyces phaeochromogenes TaxID=1923 RepID=UPI0027929D37|nr:acyl-CoA dehydrogenase family protein [Streptomyces phaeochromogenes]MDQ0946355.1 alkylation response protein AidB-like acyl-CoA dehydrogenase [Streptomyces phaeochromogenes]
MSQPDPDAWRTQVRQWLATVLQPARTPESASESADLAVFHKLSEDEERLLLERCRAYHRARFDAGYQALTLPADKGGAGLTAAHVAVFAEEESAFEVPPSTELISVTVRLVAMAISLFGTAEQRHDHARAFLRTDLLACQLFSEPGAGSDLAAVRTRARQDQDHWVLDGQKVWTSGAQFADYGLLLARTDPDVVKQGGITAFLVPMDATGVEVRPIRQMSGGASFNEVFLSGVRVPDRLRIGRPGQGWEVATATLAFERTASGSGNRRKGGTFSDVLALARSLGTTADPLVRQRLADLYVRAALRAATVDRVARANAAGGRPGPEASLTKLMASDLLTRTGQAAAELMGARISADTGEPGTFAWTQHLLGAPGYRLAGGTDQIQRNLIGERVLKLPPEPRADRAPFSQLPGN